MNKEVKTLYTSAARTATPEAVVINTGNAPAVYFVVEVTAATATPSVVFTFDLYDPESGTSVNLLTSAAVTAVSSNIYKISPALTASDNLVAAEHVPQNLLVTATHADADSITYSVTAHLL